MTLDPDIDLVVFDILGTLVDEPGGIRRALRSALPDLAEEAAGELVDVWQRYVGDQQEEIVAGGRPFVASTVIDREAAARVAARAGVDDPDVVDRLVTSVQRLDPWPDSVRALGRIASRFPVVGLSSASPSALTRITSHAGLRFHQVLSAADARSFKPHPDVYRLAIENAGSPPERLLKVAAHAWDLRGAQAVGMRTAYVERPVGDPPRGDDTFDLSTQSLDELATILCDG